ncbi:hypothetical protein HWV62_39551 [Athelia sp. TMB]|nr:hypothetical protein HWV62_39551 [Athelia sp. TMB]
MRNISLLSSQSVLVPGAHITATALDLDRNVLYAASERQNLDADVDIEIWKVEINTQGSQASLLTMFSTVASSIPPKLVNQVASLKVLPETSQLSLIVRGGDLCILNLEDDQAMFEVEGTVDSGILASAWSPDESLLALVTDAPINVGWGSKQTQFHGSAGKAAAQAPSPLAQSNIGSSPDDDTIPRVSWRGDGALFVVSSLSLLNPQVPEALRKRVLRIYDRQAALQSTSEPVAGLEHTLAWRPSGNVIVATQRFGFEGGGAGKEGRHDVVFFEKNGLRHGDFGLRESFSRSDTSQVSSTDSKTQWGYKVKETLWSSDSNVLAIWISRDLEDVAHVSLSSDDLLAAVWPSGYLQVWKLNTRLHTGRGKPINPTIVWSYNANGNGPYRQVSLSSAEDLSFQVATLGSDKSGFDFITVHKVANDLTSIVSNVKLPLRNGRLVTSMASVVWQCPSGKLYDRMSHSGKIYVADRSGNSTTIATNANSMTIASGFLIYTSTSHEAHFAPLDTLSSLLVAGSAEGSQAVAQEWERRRVERGSRIVTAVPSAMSLVLQMPRGNLETIYPRPLVMEVVRKDLERKHRIDLSAIVDNDQATFMTRVSSFVEQIDDVDHINLFLTSIGRGPQPPEVIASLCDAIRLELETKDIKRYVNSILTAYVVKTPPDHESALALLLQLREKESNIVEDAVKYIIFLVDANSLFDTALGMYDFSLVLMIAQHAQKDPREYLPFLRELRALSPFYQRFKIDDHLKRYSKALLNLSSAGPEHFEEAKLYIEQHSLYEQALKIWKDATEYQAILDLYVFIAAQNSHKAMVAFEKSLQWQELFDLALREGVPAEDLTSMAYRVSEDLSSKKRYSDSARVLLDYCKDSRQAVIALVQGNSFSEARRIATLWGSSDLMTEIIHPGALDSRAQFSEDISEMREQLEKQVNRLRELRIKKIEEPDAFYGTEDVALSNVDVMTDVSMPATAFTRYTVAPTSASRTSKRSSRSKRKMERKVGSGRKGTVDEEEYLLKSNSKLNDELAGDVNNLLPHLQQFPEEYRAEGLSLKDDLSRLEQELKSSVEEIWKKPDDADNEFKAESWAARMDAKEKERQVDPLQRVEKPTVLEGINWRVINLLSDST